MGRIRKFYENRFRWLAAKFDTPPEEFARDCFLRAAELSASPQLEHHSADFSLALIHAELHRNAGAKHFPRNFVCDAGLGGLARWLRAAGYEAIWKPDLDDAGIIREAQRANRTLVTTDTMMMERGVLRDEVLPSVCVPSSLTCEEQLAVVFRELGLDLREPRCMACGGELRRVSKEQVANRIPPRTALWLDEYFLCAECDHLFWRGTHWQKIFGELKQLAPH